MSSICEWQARSGKLVALGPKLGFREICLFGTEQCLEKPKIFTKKKKKFQFLLKVITGAAFLMAAAILQALWGDPRPLHILAHQALSTQLQHLCGPWTLPSLAFLAWTPLSPDGVQSR